MSNLFREKFVFSILFLQNKSMMTRTKRRVRQFVTSKNFSFWSAYVIISFAFFLGPENSWVVIQN